MSRLINPGLGDYTDRLTILALKILFGEAGGKDVAHFRTEQTILLTKIRSRETAGAWLAATFELAAVNAILWHAEDEMRRLRLLPEPQRAQWAGSGAMWQQQVADCGMRIQELNDRRAGLIDQINKEAGDVVGAEKV